MTLVGLAARNVLRNKFRALLTVAGVAVAIVTFLLLRTVLSAWTAAADYAAKDRVVTRHKVTFIMTLPLTYAQSVRQLPGVKASTWCNWFGGKDPKHDKEFFGSLACDTETAFTVYDDMVVTPDILDQWKHDPQGVIVGDVIAKKMGWKPGDKIIIQSPIYPKQGGDWEFRVTGIYQAKSKAVDRSSFIFHWKYLNDNLTGPRKDQIGWIVSRVNDPSQAAAMGVAIDKVFDEKEIQTLSQDERAFNASFLASISAVLTAINIISVVILVIMALILGNTIAMGVRERTNEYGVLKALGFTNNHVVMFIVVEAIVIGIAGGIIGLAIGYPFIEGGLGKFLEENMGAFFPYFKIDPRMSVLAMFLAVGLAAAASVIPAISAARLKTVDALKRIA